MSASYNTIQAGWESFSAPMPQYLTPTEMDVLRGAYYCGARAAIGIVLRAGELSPEAYIGVLEGLREEMLAFADDVVSQKSSSLPYFRADQQSIVGLNFAVPVIGTGPEGVRRAMAAIEIAKHVFDKFENPAQAAPYLIEAVQHLLAMGVTEDRIANNLDNNLGWWAAVMADGTPPETAAHEFVRIDGAGVSMPEAWQ